MLVNETNIAYSPLQVHWCE